MNLRVLAKSRKAPAVGDVFALQLPDGRFIFGRVVSVEASVGAFKPCVLIYIYRVFAGEKEPAPQLDRADLLIAPVMTNQLPWKHGYFETVDHRPLKEADRLPQHCFRDLRGWFFDEHSNRLPGPVEPVGVWGVSSFRTIDDKVSKALGIPLAPDA